jgi:hypothetical protein
MQLGVAIPAPFLSLSRPSRILKPRILLRTAEMAMQKLHDKAI